MSMNNTDELMLCARLSKKIFFWAVVDLLSLLVKGALYSTYRLARDSSQGKWSELVVPF